MSIDTATGDPIEPKGFKASLVRSLLTQYWIFTVYVLMYAVVGLGMASLVAGFEPVTSLLLLVALWFGLEGLHAIDLADEGVTVDLDANVQTVVGYVQVAFGCLFGALVALRTSYVFLFLVPIAALSGLAYNEEWFDGKFHDRDELTGLANFGLSWGFIPALAGWVALTGSYALPGLLLAVAAGLDAATLNYLVGPSKMERYRDCGIRTTRDYTPDPDVMEYRMYTANKIQLASWVFLGAAVFALVFA